MAPVERFLNTTINQPSVSAEGVWVHGVFLCLHLHHCHIVMFM